MATIGFIGLGNMGGPMAANLLKAQHKVTGYDVVATPLSSLELQGGKAAANATEAAMAGDIVVTMLPAGPQVRSSAWPNCRDSKNLLRIARDALCRAAKSVKVARDRTVVLTIFWRVCCREKPRGRVFGDQRNQATAKMRLTVERDRKKHAA